MSNPEIKITLTGFDKFLDSLGWLLLALLWSYTIYSLINLPEIIPIHFNSSGIPDRYGKKGFVVIMPIIGTFVVIGLHYLNKIPHLHNHSVKVNPKNAEALYLNSTRMLRLIKISILLVFILVSTAFQSGTTLSLSWLLPVLCVLFLGPTIYYVFRSYQLR